MFEQTFKNIGIPIYISFLIFSPSSPPSSGTPERGNVDTVRAGYTWSELTPRAEFPTGYNFHLFAVNDTLRAFHYNGVWVSPDGAHWKKTELTNIVKGQAFLGYVQFNGMIYGLGTFEGNIEHYTQTTQIARTSDFRTWEILVKESNLPKRYFYHPFVFQGNIWIIGGEDKQGKYSDAWNSPDGVHWTKVAENLPFGKRAGQHFTLFHDKLYMLDRDAWVSPDGIHWQQLTSKIAEGEIFGYSVEVFDNAIWLIGCNRGGTFRSEVLSSPDGIHWQASRAPWSPRGGTATCLFNSQLIMTGGKYGGPGIAGQTEFVYSNDVWALKKK
jgi:hypothetical protein